MWQIARTGRFLVPTPRSFAPQLFLLGWIPCTSSPKTIMSFALQSLVLPIAFEGVLYGKKRIFCPRDRPLLIARGSLRNSSMLDFRILLCIDVRLSHVQPTALRLTTHILYRHRGLRNSRARQLLLIITLLMFAASTGFTISDVQSRLHFGLPLLTIASDRDGLQVVNSELSIPQVIFVRINVRQNAVHSFSCALRR